MSDTTEAPEAPEETAAPETAEYSLPDGVMAMTDDDGVVITLFQNNPEHGADIRVGGEWVPLTDPTVLEDLAFVGVQDDAVEFYDTHAADGKLSPIKFYTPTAEGPFWTDLIPLDDDELVKDEEEDETEAEDNAEEEKDEPIAASITLSGAEDLDAAITAAVDDPDLRWYVERRVAALGLKASLPWLRN